MTNLSAQQEAYFKDSKIRDKEGNLIPCYHGTPNGDFTYFDNTRKFDGKNAFSWFSNDKGLSSTYSDDEDEEDYFDAFEEKPSKAKVFDVYLNITAPIYVGELDRECFEIKNGKLYMTDELVQVAANCNIEPKSFAKFAYDYYKNNLSGEVPGLEDLQLFDVVKNPEFRQLLLKHNPNCDGIICVDNDGKSTTYGIMEPNQAKLISNLNPTTNKDFDK